MLGDPKITSLPDNFESQGVNKLIILRGQIIIIGVVLSKCS